MEVVVSALATFSPAKLNLFLAVTERRPDGFHNLLSVVAPISFGDGLSFEMRAGADFSLACSDPAVPTGGENLVLKAARDFAQRCAPGLGGHFVLEKRIPMGAGLGGGSSNAALALRLLNKASGNRLEEAALSELAAGIGSDCPLFLQPRPVVMRGRGEVLANLPMEAVRRIVGRTVLLFKPSFGISTPWAYQQLAAKAPASYLTPEEAERRYSAWVDAADLPLEYLLFNNMEVPAFAKYTALGSLLSLIHERFGLAARMSGSGSCCFAMLPEGFDVEPLKALIRAAWGDSVFLVSTHL